MTSGVPTTEDKLLGLASVVCLQGWGFAVLVCVCVPGVCRVLVWDVSTTCTFNLHNLEQTNRFLFRQFRLPGLGLFALFIWKTTSEDSSTRFEVLSYFISDETCRTLDETYLGCSFQFDSFSNART